MSSGFASTFLARSVMKVFTSAGKSSGCPWSSGRPAAAIAPAGAPRPGAGLGGSGVRIAVQTPRPESRRRPNTARPPVVSCQGDATPWGRGAGAPTSEWPHSEQNFAPGATLVPHCEQKRRGISGEDIGGRPGVEGAPRLIVRLSARAGGFALRLLAHALEVVTRDGVERRVAPQQQDDPARDRQRQLLDPEAEVADQEGLRRAGLAAEQPDEDQLANPLARGRRGDERAE